MVDPSQIREHLEVVGPAAYREFTKVPLISAEPLLI